MYLKYIMCTSGRKTLQGKNLESFFVAENLLKSLLRQKVCFAITKNLLFSVRYCTIEGYRYMEVTHYGKSDGSEHQC